MSKVLVTFSADWADEFDVEGFYIYDKQRWDEIVEGMKVTKYPKSYCFGSNECIDFENFRDWAGSYSVRKLTNEEYNLLKELKLTEFGDFYHADPEDYDD